MTLGLVVHFFDFRNDVRELINALSAHCEVVLFIKKEDEETIRAMVHSEYKIRFIEERKRSLWNKFWELAFRFFGVLPESRQNFYLMESFKISVINNGEKAKSALKWLNFSLQLPRILSYDQFINQLEFSGKTDLSGIDQFLCFTELSDNYLISRLIEEGKKCTVYVYSWDHPCKHLRFSSRLKYLAWHEGIKADLIQLQKIPDQQIKILGATQMGYVQHFLDRRDQTESPFPFQYIYFGCAIGVPLLVPVELEIVRKAAAALAIVSPDWKLVVRPYPVLKDWTPYENLKAIENVVVDDGFRSAKATNLAGSAESIFNKFAAIHHSKAFMHLGTTLGIEACFTQSPSLLLDLDDYADLDAVFSVHHFVHQYQNDKYLNLRGYQNVIHSAKELKSVLQTLRTNPESLLSYNLKLAEEFNPKTFNQLADQFMKLTST